MSVQEGVNHCERSALPLWEAQASSAPWEVHRVSFAALL